jgi:SAM-dependent methyltransferase
MHPVTNLKRQVGWVRWALRQRGFLGSIRMAAGRLRRGSPDPIMVHPFDLQHGLETSGLIHGGALGDGHRHAAFSTAYLGVPPSRMRALLNRWRETPGVLPIEQYTFVDVGCGKGRALLLASEMPFREVVGIELDRDLTQVAGQNLERWRAGIQTSCPLRVLHGDATEAQLPEGPLVVYLYNPFLAPVFRRLLERLQQRSALVDLLYLYPKEEAVFKEFPAFQLLWREGMRLAPEDIGVDELNDVEDPCSAYRFQP